jgi:hypothetical protein
MKCGGTIYAEVLGMPQAILCPACGARHEVPEEYLRLARATVERCPACGGRIPIGDAPGVGPTKPIIGYATPEHLAEPAGPEGNCWTDGKHLVILAETRTPDRCVRCNAPAGGYLKRTKFSEQVGSTTSTRSGGGIFGAIMMLITVIVLIVEMATRKSAFVHLAYCPRHRRTSKAVPIGVVMMVLGLGVMVCGIVRVSGPYPTATPSEQAINIAMLIVGGIGCVVGVVMVAMLRNGVDCVRLEGNRVYLKRVCREFLDGLPPGPPAKGK